METVIHRSMQASGGPGADDSRGRLCSFRQTRASRRGPVRLITWPVTAQLAIAALSASLLAGCKSSSPAPYVAPRVVGRVVDARTSQPLAGVTVRRVLGDQDIAPDAPAHGGQIMVRPPTVRTGEDGAFVLASVRDFTPFRRSGWYGVRISFAHPDYLRRVILYTLTDSTNTAKGEPLVKTGDVRLEPMTK